MTNGTTTLTFKHVKHGTRAAVEAALSGLALAIAWAPDGTDLQNEIETVRGNLLAIRKRMVAPKTTNPDTLIPLN